jgi:hypothetical protein
MVISMVFNASYNNISVISRSVLLVKENGVPGENYRPAGAETINLSVTNKKVVKYRRAMAEIISQTIIQLEKQTATFTVIMYSV